MIKIAHLYYDFTNFHDDINNIKALIKQLNHQGIDNQVEFLTTNNKVDFLKYDFIYIGPSDYDKQEKILKHLLKNKYKIKEAITKNTFFLVSGNTLELFGKYIKNTNNKKIKTLNIFDFYSIREQFQLVDKLLVKEKNYNLMIFGYQNQYSTMHNLTTPLFEVVKGIGSHPNSIVEGVHVNNFYGTYIVNSILENNPKLLKEITKKLILNIDSNFKFKPFRLYSKMKMYNDNINSLQKQ